MIFPAALWHWDRLIL